MGCKINGPDPSASCGVKNVMDDPREVLERDEEEPTVECHEDEVVLEV